jgi:hypothetical protein
MGTENNETTREGLAGLILMGPFGSGKSYLGNRLREKGIADYVELEPIVYGRFGRGPVFDLERATAFIRAHYEDSLSAAGKLVAFESTGVVQRPLVLDIIARYEVALVRVSTPKDLCVARVARRNEESSRPIALSKVVAFHDYWITEIAPTYDFSLEVDGTNDKVALRTISQFVQNYGVTDR